MANRQKWLLPKQRTCVCCQQSYERGDERLMTVYVSLYAKTMEKPLNRSEGVRVDRDCLAMALASPQSRERKLITAALCEALLPNYKKAVTLPETLLEPVAEAQL